MPKDVPGGWGLSESLEELDGEIVTETELVAGVDRLDGREHPVGPFRGRESDGFGWPRRDGLKWPHFALVDVLGGSVTDARLRSWEAVARRARVERDLSRVRAS